ncbi:MAG: hypothetical protein SFX18_16400 [Pirellulales bacterium]|nr:hypothetical protein [Pirellulales bacterium]
MEPLATSDGKSTNLARDLKVMWETKSIDVGNDPTHGPNPRASTDNAIDAASRVFKTIELRGKTREEVLAALGDPIENSKSSYNFPFFPTGSDTMVFRFDNGANGIQFNVKFDMHKKVSEIEELWIE